MCEPQRRSGGIKAGGVAAAVAVGGFVAVAARGRESTATPKTAAAPVRASAPVQSDGISWATVAVTAAIMLLLTALVAYVAVKVRRHRARQALPVQLPAQRALTARPAGVRQPLALPASQSAREWLESGQR